MKKKYSKEYFNKLREESAKTYYNTPALNWGSLVDGKYVTQDRYEFKWKIAVGENKTLTPLNMDLHEYIKQFKYNNEMAGRSVSAFVGTDSQNHLSYTRFVIALCLRIEGNGVHVLIHRFDMPKIYDYRYKLLKETDITAEFARNNKEFFREIDMSLEIHSDYNNMTNHKSNGVVTEAKNYMKTLGFDMKIKPNSWAASYSADHFC